MLVRRTRVLAPQARLERERSISGVLLRIARPVSSRRPSGQPTMTRTPESAAEVDEGRLRRLVENTVHMETRPWTTEPPTAFGLVLTTASSDSGPVPIGWLIRRSGGTVGGSRDHRT